MSMQSHFQVNVALNGKHFFATDPKSCTTPFEEVAVKWFNQIKAQFPESEGFRCTLTYWEGRGYKFDTDKEG